MASLIAEIERLEAESRVAPEPDPGTFTAHSLAADGGLSMTTAQRRIETGLARGYIVPAGKRITITRSGAMRPANQYRLAKPTSSPKR